MLIIMPLKYEDKRICHQHLYSPEAFAFVSQSKRKNKLCLLKDRRKNKIIYSGRLIEEKVRKLSGLKWIEISTRLFDIFIIAVFSFINRWRSLCDGDILLVIFFSDWRDLLDLFTTPGVLKRPQLGVLIVMIILQNLFSNYSC